MARPPGSTFPASGSTRSRGHALALAIGVVCGAVIACSGRPPPLPVADAGAIGGAGGSGGGTTGVGGGAPDGGLPLSQACTRLNARRCEALRRCGLIGDDTTSYRDCVALYTATWCGPTRWPPRVEVGTVRYDAVRAQACADDWATRSCGEVSTEPASCQRFLVPAVPLQGRCYDGYAECIDGVCRGGGCPRRCLARGGVGEACLAMSDCAAGLSCRPGASGSGQCAALGAEGEACGLSLACGPGLVCVGASCRRLPPAGEACLQGRCDDGAYCSTGADGGSCEARRDAGVGCVDDAECLPSLVCDATARTCVVAQVAAPGDECSPGQRCPAGTVCLIEANASTGTCGAPRDDGAPCERAGDCASHLTCLPGDGGQACRARNADGAPCTVTRDCLAFSACVAGTCVALPTLGRPCAADRPCLWGTCLDGPDGGAVCAEAQGPGQSCRSASDCASGRCEQGFCTAACLP